MEKLTVRGYATPYIMMVRFHIQGVTKLYRQNKTTYEAKQTAYYGVIFFAKIRF